MFFCLVVPSSFQTIFFFSTNKIYVLCRCKLTNHARLQCHVRPNQGNGANAAAGDELISHANAFRVRVLKYDHLPLSAFSNLNVVRVISISNSHEDDSFFERIVFFTIRYYWQCLLNSRLYKPHNREK
jgi:hypothetical protein